MWFLRSVWAFFLDLLETVVISFAMFVIVYLFLFQPHQVEGNSMQPTFDNAEYILTDKVSYRFRDPQRGDVIVFNSPHDERVDFIKRIVGVPGDTVMLLSREVVLNGNVMEETYVKENYTPAGRFMKEKVPVSVPSGQYIVMGDNRKNSSDSREWGFVAESNIVGRAFFRYWPPRVFGVIPTAEIALDLGAVKGVLDTQ